MSTAAIPRRDHSRQLGVWSRHPPEACDHHSRDDDPDRDVAKPTTPDTTVALTSLLDLTSKSGLLLGELLLACCAVCA